MPINETADWSRIKNIIDSSVCPIKWRRRSFVWFYNFLWCMSGIWMWYVDISIYIDWLLVQGYESLTVKPDVVIEIDIQDYIVWWRTFCLFFLLISHMDMLINACVCLSLVSCLQTNWWSLEQKCISVETEIK